ncbi:MAG: esterase family protein [Clostridia bacterium]|nr:esterase family protein [Clostridia bacterium]
MKTENIRFYSCHLDREMECKLYGHGGQPILFIPCQDGRFFDFENFHMTDTFGQWLENGEVCVLAVDTIDKETWSEPLTPAFDRIRRHEAWMEYLVGEAVPLLHQATGRQDVIAFGCSLGATHAVNLFLRFPDTFDGCLALSGIYDAAYGFGDYMDEIVYRNSPVHYMENLPWDHPYVEKYNRGRGIICVGTGAWEIPDTTFRLKELFDQKGIRIWVDVWGSDVEHDWPWWHKQVSYFVPKLLGKE